MKDILVLDIETKNTFFDVGGQGNLNRLEMSVAVVYSYNQDKYMSFWEKDLPALNDLMKDCGMVVGFNIGYFDLPVLDKYFNFSTRALRKVDIFEEIELNVGKRISLDLVAQTNLGVGKTHSSGLEAIRLWNEGDLEELESYCRNDVKITKEVYDLALKQGYLMIPEKGSDKLIKVPMNFKDRVQTILSENTLF